MEKQLKKTVIGLPASLITPPAYSWTGYARRSSKAGRGTTTEKTVIGLPPPLITPPAYSWTDYSRRDRNPSRRTTTEKNCYWIIAPADNTVRVDNTDPVNKCCYPTIVCAGEDKFEVPCPTPISRDSSVKLSSNQSGKFIRPIMVIRSIMLIRFREFPYVTILSAFFLKLCLNAIDIFNSNIVTLFEKK